MQKIFSAIACILVLSAFVPYIRAILRKETRPAKASWIIWANLDTITLLGMLFKDAVNGQILGAVLGVWVVALLALKHGTPGWTTIDKFCLSGTIIGIILWQTFNNPVLAIMTGCSLIFLGSIPTFVSAWNNPQYENGLAWVLFWTSCVFAMMAIPSWTLEDAAQPITFTVIESTMMYILFIRPRLPV